MLTKSRVAYAALLLVAGTQAQAGPVAPGFTNLGTVTPCDDCSTALVPTSFALNYFNNTYNGFYISNNGYITFQSGQGSYTPSGLGADYSGQPIIAPFFADVDTRAAGSVTYGTGTYDGRNAYGVTWNGVGYFPSQSNLTNTFQLLLTDRSDTGAGNFDIFFNYGQIQWETGSASGGSGGFGGTPAAAGFNAGTGNAPGTFYQLPGSLQTMSFEDTGSNPLVQQTNNGVPGELRFGVRAGAVIVTPQPPSGAVPEPSTWAMMLVGFGAVGGAMRRSRKVRVRQMAATAA